MASIARETQGVNDHFDELLWVVMAVGDSRRGEEAYAWGQRIGVREREKGRGRLESGTER